MQRHRVVELRLGQPGLDADRHRLQNLRRIRPDHVRTDHLVARFVDDEFIQRTLVASGEHVAHRPEIRGEDLDRAIMVARRRLAQPDAAERRVGEYRARDGAVIDPPAPGAKQSVGNGMALADGDGRQLHPVGDIADGMDVRHIGLAVGIDADGAAVVECNPGGRKRQPFDIGPPPDRPQEHIGFDRLAIAEVHGDGVTRFFQPVEPAVQFEIDALGHRNAEQPFGERRFPIAQDRLAAVDQRHLDAQFMEHPGEFIGDIAAAGDDHAARQRWQVKYLVGGDAKLGTRDLGNERPRPGGDKDVAGGIVPAIDGNGMRIDEAGVAMQRRHLVAVEGGLVQAVEPVDLGQHIVTQRRPVETLAADLPAVALRIDEILGEMCAIDEQFLGHTAPDDAGAANTKLLGHRDPRAMAGGDAAGAHPARSGADDEQVEIKVGGFGHGWGFRGNKRPHPSPLRGGRG